MLGQAESEFHSAGRKVVQPPIRPIINEDLEVGCGMCEVQEVDSGKGIWCKKGVGAVRKILANATTQGEQDLEVDSEAEDEGRAPRVATDPGRPTQREIDEHNVLHWPFRSWCPHCVRGKGVSSPHRTTDDKEDRLDETGITTVSMDYCFVTPGEDEDRSAKDHPVLIIYDKRTASMFALPVGHKGPQPWVVRWVVAKLNTIGYAGVEITVKSDGEAAIKALVNAIAVARKAVTAIIQSPARESQCNGAVERAVRTWRGQFVTLKDYAERGMGTEIEVDGKVLQWLAVYAAEVLNHFKIQKNGRTAYEMVTSHRFKGLSLAFGENVIFRTPPPKHGKAATDWKFGIFLGIMGRTSEMIVGNEQGVFTMRTLRRRPEKDRWSPCTNTTVAISVMEYFGDKSSDDGPAIVVPMIDGEEGPAATARRGGFKARNLMLMPADFRAHGYTGGCPGCVSIETGIGPKRQHSTHCRDRIQTELCKTDDGRARVERARGRIDHDIAKQIEEANQPATSTEILHDAPIPNTEAQEAAVEADDAEMPDTEEVKLEELPTVASDRRGMVAPRDAAQKRTERPDADMDSPSRAPPPRKMTRGPSDETMVQPATTMAPMPGSSTDIPANGSASDQHASPTDSSVADDAPMDPRTTDGGDAEMLMINAMSRGSDLIEVYSPERVAKVCVKYGLMATGSFDLRTGWDFTKKEDQDRALCKIRTDKPNLVIGSPPCTKFSILMGLVHAKGLTDEQKAKFMKELREAIAHLRFCVKIYNIQRREGRYFLHEHPLTASSWGVECIEKLCGQHDVFTTSCHQCAYGLTTTDTDRTTVRPALKPTRFMTNSWMMLQRLSLRCSCAEGPDGRKHAPLISGRAAKAAEYPVKLCEAMCAGLRDQLTHDRRGEVRTRDLNPIQLCTYISSMCGTSGGKLMNVANGVGATKWPQHWRDDRHEPDGTSKQRKAADDGPSLLAKQLNTLYETEVGLKAWDDPNGCELDPMAVQEARRVELDYFKKQGVYRKVPRSDAKAIGGKIIKLKWIDTNKGDNTTPNMRSRLVGKEFRDYDNPEHFASTPPLEGMRAVISRAATDDGQARAVMVNDIARAYFNAKMDRDLFCELPEEDRVPGEDMVGKLELCLYGIRDAAKSWQECLATHLREIGFVRGTAFPSVYYNKELDIMCVVHGDDYISSGPVESLKTMRKSLETRFEVSKTFVIGHGKDMLSEGKVLNRIIRATDNGYELEADIRHAELLIKQMSFEGTKGVTTPGIVDPDKQPGDDAEEITLAPADATAFRGMSARLNYLSVDRPELQFAAKEICRDMSSPNDKSWDKLKRVVRYLVKRPRGVIRYDWQPDPVGVDVFSDANWAACRGTRKSTSGGCVMHGTHLIRSWAKTQATIALSSGESELIAAVKGGAEALGALSLFADLGLTKTAAMHLDASAALGILQRRGVGKLRHLDVGLLWLQEHEAKGAVKLGKVKGEQNPADLGTKHLTEEVMLRHLARMNVELRDGRASIATKLLNVEKYPSPTCRPQRESVVYGKWLKLSGGIWCRIEKNARALRGVPPGGPDWREVDTYIVNDFRTAENIHSLDVRDIEASDPRLRSRLGSQTTIETILITRNACTSEIARLQNRRRLTTTTTTTTKSTDERTKIRQKLNVVSRRFSGDPRRHGDGRNDESDTTSGAYAVPRREGWRHRRMHEAWGRTVRDVCQETPVCNTSKYPPFCSANTSTNTFANIFPIPGRVASKVFVCDSTPLPLVFVSSPVCLSRRFTSEGLSGGTREFSGLDAMIPWRICGRGGVQKDSRGFVVELSRMSVDIWLKPTRPVLPARRTAVVIADLAW